MQHRTAFTEILTASPHQSDPPRLPLAEIVVDRGPAVLGITRERILSVERILHRPAEHRLVGQEMPLRQQPVVQIVEQRLAAGLALSETLRRSVGAAASWKLIAKPSFGD